MKPAELTKGAVVKWLRERRGAKVSEPSLKASFILLSRFCSWLSAADIIEANPCRAVPTVERPQDSPKRERPWLQDETVVRALVFALPPSYALMFAVGRTCGARPAEVCGLRVADTDRLEAEGVLTVRGSYDQGMLKEDKGRGGARKSKLAPIHDPTVAGALLGLAKRRREAGAKDGDRLFDHLLAKPGAMRTAWARAFKKAKAAVEAAATRVAGEPVTIPTKWYDSTRHSFASDALAHGARYEEVSKALGHASVATTARYYDRQVERAFATLPARNLGAPVQEAKVLAFPDRKASAS